MYGKNFVFIAFVSLLLFNKASSQDVLLKKADELYKGGKYYEALSEYEKVLATNDHNPSVYVELAKCHLLISPRGKSIKYISKAFEFAAFPTLEMELILARAYHVNNEFDQAIKQYRKADPDHYNFKTTTKFVSECENAKKYFSDPVKVDIINAGTTINTEHQEYLPYITADHLQLFFTSIRPDQALQNDHESLYEDIYDARFKAGRWMSPTEIKSLNEQGHDACVGISEDGQTMFVYKGINGGDLYTSELTGTHWGKIKPFPYNTQGFEGAASLSPDGLTLYFIHAPNASDDRDIYVCNRVPGGKWSKPYPLESVNTEYDEESPFMHPDGKTLYFSSKGHATMGGYDIFKTVKLQDGTWSEPKNLGYPINSTADDVYFILSADGKIGFYSSDKEGGYGKQDIYIIKMVHENEYALELLTGEVRDEKGYAVEANITVTDNKTNELVATFKSNSEDGRFLVSLPCGRNYGIYIEKEGFIFHSENAQLECQSGFKEVRKQIKLMGTHSGSKVILNNVFFDHGKSDLKTESTTELKKLIKLLNDNPAIRIEISGYTDNSGEEAFNLTLSEMRAQNVMNYLIKNGISKARLTAIGFGSSQPMSNNETEEGRQLNRRTEFRIL